MERGPMALFGAIVAVGLGPALWLGVRLSVVDSIPSDPAPATTDQRAGVGNQLLGPVGQNGGVGAGDLPTAQPSATGTPTLNPYPAAAVSPSVSPSALVSAAPIGSMSTAPQDPPSADPSSSAPVTGPSGDPSSGNPGGGNPGGGYPGGGGPGTGGPTNGDPTGGDPTNGTGGGTDSDDGILNNNGILNGTDINLGR